VIDPVAVGRYAIALFGAAKSSSSIDAVAADLESLSQARAAEDLIHCLENPRYNMDLKRQVIDALGQKCSSPMTAKFLHVLLRKSRIGLLPGIAAKFRELVKEAGGVVSCEVILAAKPSAAFSKIIEKALKRITHTEVEMAVKVDLAVMGGIALKIKNKILDATFSKRLYDLKYDLLQTKKG
jgi:F-type H+-transporting ATPase subunit delta